MPSNLLELISVALQCPGTNGGRIAYTPGSTLCLSSYVSFPMSQLLAFQIHLYKQYLALIDSYVIKMAFL